LILSAFAKHKGGGGPPEGWWRGTRRNSKPNRPALPQEQIWFAQSHKAAKRSILTHSIDLRRGVAASAHPEPVEPKATAGQRRADAGDLRTKPQSAQRSSVSSPCPDMSTLSKERRAEIERALDAMRRAAAMARQIAIDTNTGIVICRDGKPVLISAAELREGKL
jgi:hypothetical protein